MVVSFHCMRKVEKKYKRNPIDWVRVIHDLGDDLILAHYYSYIKSHCRMSSNRCAWNVLKKYYSTTSLHLFRQYHYPLMDVDRIR